MVREYFMWHSCTCSWFIQILTAHISIRIILTWKFPEITGAVEITMLGRFSNSALALRHPDNVVFAFHMTKLSWSGYKLRGMVLSVVLCCCGSIPFKVEWAAHSQMPFSPPLLFRAVICLLACVLPVILEKSASGVQLFLSCWKTSSGNCKLLWCANSLMAEKLIDSSAK